MVYDLIVIGGGPAGYLGAERAGHAGLNTLLIEKRFIGGVCLNEGCIPSKSLLYSAKIYDNAKHGEKYGVFVNDISFNHEAVIERKNKVVKTLVSGIKSQLKKNKVTVVEGFGEILGRNQDGYEVKVGDQTYTAKRLLIATGSMPIIPPIPGVKEGLEQGYVLTNREILDIKSVPSSLVIVGGGVIGLEMASYFNSVGSKVTIIEMLDHIAGNTDREISEILMKNYMKKGIEFKLNSKVVEVKPGSVVYESNGETFSVEAEKVLMSIGRRAVTEGIGLENIGVELDRGRIKVDERGKTNVPEVYAAGDVNGVSMLAHTAYREAEVCVNNMLGKKDIMRYNAIPSIIYTNPEVAGVGETEETAKKKGIDYEVANLSMRYSGRYLAENEGGDGICKVLIDKKYRKVIGVHMIGNYSSEIIYGAGLMIETEMRVDDIKELVFPHPTVCEVIREGIFALD
ncbi:MAG TPA: dihydrolipoyl dehydrogenase [Clostridiaceae bacterium]|nr:dihydrolipoyl dehydrogenase [Clostridiaceae bacterium]